MGDLVLICRASDGLPLVEVWDGCFTPDPINSKNGDISNRTSTGRRSNQSIKMYSRAISRRLPSGPSKCSISEDENCYHYVIENGICYLTATPSDYPKKLVFTFLAELCTAFALEFQKTFGSQYQDIPSAVKAIEKPYHFMNFDRVIHRIKHNFRDPNSSKALSMVNSSLTEVTNIMRKNIDEIINRGENLEDIGRLADGLRAETEKFKASSKMLSKRRFLERYSLGIFVGILFILLFYYYTRR